MNVSLYCGVHRFCRLVIPREAVRRFSLTTVVAGHGAKWRLAHGFAVGGSKYGELTDLPDYTFLDGRPTPLGKGQIRRREENLNLTNKVMNCMSEIDFAKTRYAKMQNEADKKVRLKEKGTMSIRRKNKKKNHRS